MIEDLINELFTSCHYCHDGLVFKTDSEGQYHSDDEGTTCVQCNGSAEILSYEGEKLRHIILHGEKP